MSDQKPRHISSAIGRRKSAIASVRLVSGTGQITVNNVAIDKYFPGILAAQAFSRPFSVLNLSKYDATIKVHGGGPAGQLDAAILGLSRALSTIKLDFKTALRDANLLTRDSRERQRRMVGTGGKARRKKQSPKR